MLLSRPLCGLGGVDKGLARLLCDQTLDPSGDVLLQIRMKPAGRPAGKPRMHPANSSVSPQEECRREGIEVHGLRNGLGQLAGLTRDQDRVLNTVALDESTQPCRVLELI